MNDRERFVGTMQFRKVDMAPLIEGIGVMQETLERWLKEGLPSAEDLRKYVNFSWAAGVSVITNLTGSLESFDQMKTIDGRIVRSSKKEAAIDLAPIPRYEHKVLAEDEDSRIVVDEMGVRKRIRKKGSHVPQFLERPVKDRETFEEIRKRYDPDTPGRYPQNWEEHVKRLGDSTLPLSIYIPGFFGHLRNLMGEYNLSVSLFKDPSLVHDMQEFFLGFWIRVYQKVLDELAIDYCMVWEDMAYRRGPMISPKTFQEFMLPYYKVWTSFLRKNGVEIVLVDSDGDINSLIPLFIEGGVTGVFPVEVRANMDPVELRKKYPKLAMLGGIDKFLIAEGKEAIDQELLSKVPCLLKTGGYVPMLDHRVPPTVSFENYRYYLKAKERIVSDPANY